MHPLKKDEFRLVNRMRFEVKNVMEHINRVSEESNRINSDEIERRLKALTEYSRELANLQKAIELEIQKNAL
jgi:RecJ-like exonuclease|tara:strand:- start:598 stop:813 length:216 start_codon:yes stop_codon:yes gene_type:complete